MAEKKQLDFQMAWEETKKEAARLSKDISRWAKKGEKELVKLSGQAKIGFDMMGLKVKKEQLLHSLGRGYYETQTGKKANVNLKKMVDEVKTIDKQISTDKRLLKAKR